MNEMNAYKQIVHIISEYNYKIYSIQIFLNPKNITIIINYGENLF